MYELVCILATIVVYIHSRMYLQLYAYYVRIVNYVLTLVCDIATLQLKYAYFYYF